MGPQLKIKGDVKVMGLSIYNTVTRPRRKKKRARARMKGRQNEKKEKKERDGFYFWVVL